MKIHRLYIEDFMCYENSFIDFDQIKSALIVGRALNNDLYSNGVGKTTIFKAIEYVLFNETDFSLDKIVRDDSNKTKVTLDFSVNDEVYRVSRSRTKKGTSDLSFFKMVSDKTVFHDEKSGVIVPNNSSWKDISGRRSSDTEKLIQEKTKLTFSLFRNVAHFVQNDFSGLNTVTPENRKKILKGAMSLEVYSKLEKIAKEENSSLSKSLDKLKYQLESIGDPDQDIKEIEPKIEASKNKILSLNSKIESLKDSTKKYVEKINSLNEKSNTLTNENKNLLFKKSELESKKQTTNSKILALNEKLTSINKQIDAYKEKASNIVIERSFLDINELSKKLESLRTLISNNKALFNSNSLKIKELSEPFPDEAVCRSCRQKIDEEHAALCKEEIAKEISQIQEDNKSLKITTAQYIKDFEDIKSTIDNENKKIVKNQNDANMLADLNSKIESQSILQSDTKSIIYDLKNEFSNIEFDLKGVLDNISSLRVFETLSEIKEEIIKEKDFLKENELLIDALNKSLSEEKKELGILEFSLNKRKEDLITKKEANDKIQVLDDDLKVMQYVVESFSSSGIPNLIIQHTLDDLQEKVNDWLGTLRPGLQLEFVIEKIKDNGLKDETFDIKYYVNSRERDYEQLSGAMKIAVIFSLKLGLQKMLNCDIGFLLFDELDQALDKASVDSFASIVRSLESEYKILVITHNDRLKDKFDKAILVEQNINMVSKATIVENW